MSGKNLCGNAGEKHLQYAQRAMRKFIPVMKNDKLNLWRAVYAERCKYGFRREYGTVEVDDRLCLPHDLDIQVSRLKLLKANHTSQRYRLEDNIARHYPAQIASLKEKIAGYHTDIQTYIQNKPTDKDFSMKIGNKVFYDKKEAGTALIDICRNVKQSNMAVTVGEYQGFQIRVFFDSFLSKFTISLKGSLSHEVEIGTDPFGNLQRLNNALEAMPVQLTEAQQKLANVEHQMKTAEAEVTKPFAQEQDLKEKLERLNVLNALLNMDQNENSLEGEKWSKDGKIQLKEPEKNMKQAVFGRRR